ncbi:MAG TPA: carboxypeptidase regulatory-like domain-containing protein [Chloroflexia bacterium]|nr:carboxypeptidase regulatory-like domain-containing protein [Chloroflexia bacterium]
MTRTLPRLCLLLLGILVLALGLVHSIPAARAADATATITGRVLSLDNVPLANVVVQAHDQAGTNPNRATLAQTTTRADGTYTLAVPPGTLWIGITSGEWWGYDYTPMVVTDGAVIADINFVAAVRVLPAEVATYTPVPIGQPPATLAPAPPTAAAAEPTAVPPGLTPTPAPVFMPPGPEPGMPTAGAPQSGPGLGPLAVLLAALATLAGLALRRQTARR